MNRTLVFLRHCRTSQGARATVLQGVRSLKPVPRAPCCPGCRLSQEFQGGLGPANWLGRSNEGSGNSEAFSCSPSLRPVPASTATREIALKTLWAVRRSILICVIRVSLVLVRMIPSWRGRLGYLGCAFCTVPSLLFSESCVLARQRNVLAVNVLCFCT